MVESYVHIYEKLPLSVAGVCMGVVLVVAHLVALVWPRQVQGLMSWACGSARVGQALLIFDFVWIMLLLWDSPSNPMRMELFDFSMARGALLVLSPVVCAVLCAYSRQNLFGRALGLFLLLLGIVPLTAAYLKEPETRILIPLWWYPVLTAAIFLVPMPYLLRDCLYWLQKRVTLFRLLALAGLAYGAAVLACAILYW